MEACRSRAIVGYAVAMMMMAVVGCAAEEIASSPSPTPETGGALLASLPSIALGVMASLIALLASGFY